MCIRDRRETIAERVRDNMLMLARTGRWLGGTTPLGYTSEKMQEVVIDGRMKTSCRLREQPEELRIVDLIFEKYLELHSISGVSKYLAGQGIRSRKGKSYSLEGIKQILQNPVYLSLIHIYLIDFVFDTVVKIYEETELPSIIVEQNSEMALSIADYAYVLEVGPVSYTHLMASTAEPWPGQPV